MSQCSTVLCTPQCVCWPQGDFTAPEQRILQRLQKAVDDVNLLECAGIVRHASSVLAPRRVAHLLAVFLDFAPGVCTTFVYVASVFPSAAFGSKGTVKSFRKLLATLPLCPVGGMAIDCRTWSMSEPAVHPGRPASYFSPLHGLSRLVEPDESLLSLGIVLDRGAYPVCGCGSLHCQDFANNALRAPVISQWHRWWRRLGKRLWLRTCGCCHL
jgi:hypothetical protein